MNTIVFEEHLQQIRLSLSTETADVVVDIWIEIFGLF
jgi:hypothetical protein